MPYQIWNRRYTGSKYKLSNWISGLIHNNCKGNSFCDLFAGTAIMSKQMIDGIDEIYINDFLYSNEVIYRAFFEQLDYDFEKLQKLKNEFLEISVSQISENYVSKNFGNKFFSHNDSLRIGYIREQIERNNDLNIKEKNILIASLLYSLDRAANTVGHYDAYIKGNAIKDTFVFDLIEPYELKNKKIHISRLDANILAKSINCDIVYIDPPYNSRQYSRFYHILENITKWERPELFGTACKPKAENMSEYCRSSAKKAFEELISSLNCKYIVVSYNNTYNSKSCSSRNKISLDDIQRILESKGTTSKFEKEHPYFNAGKTDLANHKELVFITKVGN